MLTVVFLYYIWGVMTSSIQISVKVPLPDYLRLEKICFERKCKLSGVVRGLIADYVENYCLDSELDKTKEITNLIV